MRNLILALEAGGPRVWVGDGITRRHVEDPKELEGLQYWIGQKGGDPRVHEGWEDLRVLGADVTGIVSLLTDDERNILDAIKALQEPAKINLD